MNKPSNYLMYSSTHMEALHDRSLCLDMSSMSRNDAAIVIQRHVHVWIARCKAQQLRIWKKEMAKAESLRKIREQASAVQVQRAYRRYCKTKFINRIKQLGGGLALHYRLNTHLLSHGICFKK